MLAESNALVVAGSVTVVLPLVGCAAFGVIRWKQEADSFRDFGMIFGNPHFGAYARAYGAKGSRVETADRLMPLLRTAFEEHCSNYRNTVVENRRLKTMSVESIF